jgi:hypothetical protein
MFWLTLHKVGGTRQYGNKFPLRSFAHLLHKTGGTRQYGNEFPLRSFAHLLQKAGGVYSAPFENETNNNRTIK